MNVEFRTRPLELFSVQWAAAAFYDAGDAFDSFESTPPQADGFVLRSDAGVGLRVVWPELERAVFRVDFAVPFNRTPPSYASDVGAYQFFLTFGQAFGTEHITGIVPPKGNAALE
jgi:outer membrane translocation and assembly module TamA